jgi:hypothetical protein
MPISGENIIRYPFGAADVQSKAYAATIAVDIKNSETVVKVAQLTGAATINATLSAELPVGSVLTVELEADGTARTVTWGTGFTGVAYQVAISKKAVASFKFTGTTFVSTGVILIN